MEQFELLFHTPESRSQETSPFADAAASVASSAAVDIACPYIALPELKALLALSSRFRLLTDAEEWLRSLGRSQRGEVLSFIAGHLDAVRHIRDLHAKVVLSDSGLLFGSANLTDQGLHRRDEFGALVRSQSAIRSAKAWFVELWQDVAVPIDVQALRQFERDLPKEPNSEFGNPSPRLPARQTSRATPRPPAPPLATRAELVNYLSRGPFSIQLLRDYFALVGSLYQKLGIQPDDPRVVLSLPRAKWFLPLTVNNRYAALLWRDRPTSVALLIPARDVGRRNSWNGGAVHGSFRQARGEETEPPLIVVWPSVAAASKPPILVSWFKGVSAQLERATRSANLRSHSPAATTAAIDPVYRDALLTDTRR